MQGTRCSSECPSQAVPASFDVKPLDVKPFDVRFFEVGSLDDKVFDDKAFDDTVFDVKTMVAFLMVAFLNEGVSGAPKKNGPRGSFQLSSRQTRAFAGQGQGAQGRELKAGNSRQGAQKVDKLQGREREEATNAAAPFSAESPPDLSTSIPRRPLTSISRRKASSLQSNRTSSTAGFEA